MADEIHRKLSNSDYAAIRFEKEHDFTIREIATNHSISTKFVNRVLSAQVAFTESGTVRFIMDNSERLGLSSYSVGTQWTHSECGRYFSNQGELDFHIGFWTSSGTTAPQCQTVMAGFVSK